MNITVIAERNQSEVNFVSKISANLFAVNCTSKEAGPSESDQQWRTVDFPQEVSNPTQQLDG